MPKVVIMTALSDERKAVLKYLTEVNEDIHPTSGTIYRKGLFTSETGKWEVAVVRIGMGNVNAAQGAQQAIDYLSPDLLFFVGIAGGLKDVSPGDVVAANKIYQYESGKASASFFPRAEVRMSAHSLVQRAQVVAEDDEWQKRIHLQSSGVFPGAYVGAIAAGEQVLASTDSETWKLLQKSYSDALAIEMEGYGALAAAYINRGVEAIVIRSISDTLDDKVALDKQGFQYIAACHASAFAFEMLANLSVVPQGKASLEKGALALERKEYGLARSLLNNAVNEIAGSDKRLAAKARYLQALAVLGEESPRDKGLVVREKVDGLLNAAIKLDRCRAYLIALASIKRDIFEHKPSPRLQEEVCRWQDQANSVQNTPYDDELLVYWKRCQPRLYHRAW
jgi:nucleoside phosphorylase